MKKGELGHGPHVIDYLGADSLLRRCPACLNPQPTLAHHHRYERRHRWLPWPRTRVTTWSYQCACGFATVAQGSHAEAATAWNTTGDRLRKIQADCRGMHATTVHSFSHYPDGLTQLYDRPVIVVRTAKPVDRWQALQMIDLVAPHLGRDPVFVVRARKDGLTVKVTVTETRKWTQIELIVTGSLTA